MITPQLILAGVLSAIIAYLLGSINFAIVVSYLYKREDIRKYGSGNAGMTNILRTYGKLPAFFTGLGDFLKGAAGVFLARLIFSMLGVASVMDGGYIAGFFALLGHLFPIYFHFKGGKGVLTSLGIILVLNPIVFLILVGICVPFVFLVKIVSLASILGAALFPIATYLVKVIQRQPALFDTIFALLFGLIVIYMHKDNIKRLLNGTENKFGSNKNKG